MKDMNTEEQLRAALGSARSDLDTALARRRELSRLTAEYGLLSDGTITMAEADLLYTDARSRYARALARFADYTLSV